MHRNRLKIACFTVSVLFALSSAAAAQTATEITESIQQRFGNDRDYRNIDVSSSGAVVTLAGEAPSLYARAQAIQIARRTGGVDSIINDMTISGSESDQSIAEGVAKAIQEYPHLTIWDHVDGVVNNGVVTLEGMVTPDLDKASELGLEVAKVPGVQEISVDLFILSSSSGDQRIRTRIERALLGGAEPFSRYFSMLRPPIRIIVNNSVVVLLGYAQTLGDRIQLQQIVANVPGVLRVENHLVTP
jgi:osmotically-inducible protein OsmY